MKTLKVLSALTVFIFLNSALRAQEMKNPDELVKDLSAGDTRQVLSLLKSEADSYFRAGKFNEFCDLLKIVAGKDKNSAAAAAYFRGFARYSQLKYLEEKQSWDEYFNKGNDYREEISSSLNAAIKSAGENGIIGIYSRLILWQLHQDQQDVFAEEALTALVSAVKIYSGDSGDPSAIKEVADKLQDYDQKGKAGELYRLYLGKVINSGLKDDQLKAMAEGFLSAGNLELAESVYDVYAGRVVNNVPKENAVKELLAVAVKFAYKDGAVNDPVYAEKIFGQAESLSGISAFDEEMSYLRAYNLERAGDYEKTRAAYIDLLNRFPGSAYYDRVNFKLGVISAYVLKDIRSARDFFQKLAGKETAAPEVISSLYQLGVLAQWEDDQERAKANYLKLKEKAGNDFRSAVASADARLREIEENKPLDPGIKDFIDVCLRDEYSLFNMSKLELKASAYSLKKDQEFTMTATAYPPESGCMQVVLDYGWTWDPGKASPGREDSRFTSSYPESGVKVIGLVVRTPAGVLDRCIDMIDVE